MKGVRLQTTCGMLVALMLLGLAGPAQAQDEEPTSVYYRTYVDDADGTKNERTPPQVSFTAYLGSEADSILIETAPRERAEAGPNIDGNGTFGVELGNFPGLSAGDPLTIRFNSVPNSQQGIVTDTVASIPWPRFPGRLTLEAVELPPRPQDLTLEPGETTHTLTWTAQPGYTYSVYRRTLEDLSFDGQSRRLYVRLADGLTEGTFTAQVADADLTYAYIVYASSAEGVTGPHSDEVAEPIQVSGLSATATPRNATITWDAFSVPVGETTGYVVYRRIAGQDDASPIAYTGVADERGGTTYTDTRLEPGATYYYQVRARNMQGDEMGVTEEVAVTTADNTADYTTYASIKTAVLIYHDTNGGEIAKDRLDALKRALELSRTFFWRNSKMKFNIEFTYYPIEEYVAFPESGLAVHESMAHLRERGVVNTQYDLIFRFTPAIDGFWSIGTTQLDLPGPRRETGFSQMKWPYGGQKYPGSQMMDEVETGVIWMFLHEGQHAIDAMYHDNGFPEMGHGDMPFDFPVPKGEHYDFQAKMLRTFTNYEGLGRAWGDIYEAFDADRDGFPDDDARVPVDEVRFGSRLDAADSDDDGLPDRAEMYAGIYAGSDPLDTDTDGDGLLDGEDRYPRYPLRPDIKRFRPTIDGRVEAAWPLVNDSVSFAPEAFAPKFYMSHDEDSVYLAIRTDDIAIPALWLDFEGDGFWHGRGNTDMRISLSEARITRLASRDGSPEGRAFSEGGSGLWDTGSDYVEEFGRRVLSPGRVNLAVNIENLPVVEIEMAIPKDEFAGVPQQPGDSMAFYINYSKVNNTPGQEAYTFDRWSYATVWLSDERATADEPLEVQPHRFALAPNYPNPFAGSTRIEYEVARPGPVTLTIYDVLGRRVRAVEREHAASGRYLFTWDGTDEVGQEVASGVYVYELRTPEGQRRTRHLVRLR